MGTELFRGSGVAIVTPFTESGINFDTFRQLVEFQIAGGTDAIIVEGTTGEPSTQTATEKRDAIAFMVDQVKHRVPVIAGTGGNNTRQVIEDSKAAQALGADALLIVTPYYNKCTPKGLIAHYTAVASAVDLPIVIYNVPSRTALNMTPDVLCELSKIDNIVGMKEASGNLAQVGEMCRLCGDNLTMYSGEDGLVLPLMSYGGKGVISVVANIMPAYTHEMTQKYLQGDVAGATAMQLKLLPMVQAMFCETNPIPVKTALGLMGYDVGPLRLPLTPMEPAHVERLKLLMAEFGLLVVG